MPLYMNLYELLRGRCLNGEERRNPEAIIEEAVQEGVVLYDRNTGYVSLLETQKRR